MKKILSALLTISLIFMLIGCGSAPEAAEPSATEPTTPDEPEPAAALPTTGEGSVDNVGSDLTDVENLDMELDDSDLDGLDDILSDLENI